MKLKEKLVILGLLTLAGLFILIGPAVASPQIHPLGCKPSSQTTLSNHYNARYISSILQKPSSTAAAVDWSAGMPSSGDQGQQGSCVAWSVGYNYKSYQEQQERNWGLNTNSHLFSPAYIYNQIDGGVDGGASISDAMNLLVNQGDDTLDDFPYNDRDCTTQPTQAQRQRAAQYKEISWTPIFQGNANINAMKSALANGPIEAGTDVYWNAGWQTSGNISQSGVSGSSAGGHAIALVGYDDSHQTNDGAGAFKFINSWGTSWGNYGGYGWISYKYAQNNFFEAEVMYDQAPTNNTYAVSGAVSDQNQQPVSGVTMSFAIVSGNGTLPATVTTNTSGNWTQSGFQTGTTYRVTPSKANCTFTPASQDFAGTQATAFNFTANVPAPVPATISVTAPAGGENWQTGSSHMISWAYTGNPGSAVKLDLLKGGSLSSTIIASTSAGSKGSGSYSWLAPASLAAGSDYQIRVASTTVAASTSTSNSFTISAQPVSATISVTAPAGGENWQTGSSHTISWNYTGSPGTVKIDLLKGGSLSSTIIASTSAGSKGSGSYSWLAPASLAAGSDYQIRVASTTVAASTSTSNAFTISNAPSPTSTITLTYPKGGKHWPKGKYYLISWKYTGNPGNSVKIELLKGGKLYNTITSGTLMGSKGNGYYSWHISIFQASSSDFQVRITSTSAPLITSTSDYFSIGY